jgi:Putative prokaryotic signal transducing protein
MSEAELLTVAADYDSLNDAAQTALRAEFATRKLEPPTIPDESAQVESRNLVTIRRYRDLSEAIVARTVVEAAGIFCFLRDENTVRLDWQISNFIGGIRLQVSAADVEAANQVLDQPIPDVIDFGELRDYHQPHCPHCGSSDITFEGSSRKAALASLYLAAVPLPLGEESWLCNNCDTRWTDAQDSPVQPE